MINFKGITLIGEHVMVGLPREDIEKRNLTNLRKALRMVKDKKVEGRGKFHIFIDGYNYDDRELHEIKEVREFVKLAVSKHPEIFYYTAKPPLSETDKWMLACMADKIYNYQSAEDRLTATEIIDKIMKGEDTGGYNLYVEYKNGQKAKLIDEVVNYAMSLGDKEGAIELVREISKYRM